MTFLEPPKSTHRAALATVVSAAALALIGGLVVLAAVPTARAVDPVPAAVNCTIAVPADPLTAAGLATPYRLAGADGGTCVETDADQAAFVQATIIDPATGRITNYEPLVVTDGTQPAAAPVVPRLPRHAVVGIWFGFNGDALTLAGGPAALRSGRCVNGADGSVFGQFAYCNAPAFFRAANHAIAVGRLHVPAVGTGSDGRACPTTRDFGIVDQDQSDNVTSAYLVVGDRTAQSSAANAAALPGATPLTNGSDNRLVDDKVDPAIGCRPWTAPDLGDAMTPSNSLALNELQAAARQHAPAALVPLNDPMVLTAGGTASRRKTNAYRAGVDMPSLARRAGQSPSSYCRLMVSGGWARMQRDRVAFLATSSPDPAAADSLYTFLGARLQGSYDQLGCAALLGVPNPITLTQQGDLTVAVAKGAAVKAAAAVLPTGTAPGTPTPSASASTPTTPAATPGATVGP